MSAQVSAPCCVQGAAKMKPCRYREPIGMSLPKAKASQSRRSRVAGGAM